MKSKFRYQAYLVFSCGVLGSAILIFGSKKIFDPNVPLWEFFGVSFFFLFVWIWIFFGEIRTKIISIDIQFDRITVKNYLGLGFAKTFYLHEISGFRTSILSSKGGSYEYLYLMMGKKKIAKISAFYHSNYKELKKQLIAINVKNLGMERFSNRQELIDIFS